jgi:hypothetical protein
MTRPSADVREAELLQKLSDIARMKVDAEPFGNDTLEIDARTMPSFLWSCLSQCITSPNSVSVRSRNVFTKASASAGPTGHLRRCALSWRLRRAWSPDDRYRRRHRR